MDGGDAAEPAPPSVSEARHHFSRRSVHAPISAYDVPALSFSPPGKHAATTHRTFRHGISPCAGFSVWSERVEKAKPEHLAGCVGPLAFDEP